MPNFAKVAKHMARLADSAEVDPEWSEADRELAAGLRLIHDTMIARELERRSPHLRLSNGQRDGLDCLNYFFDLINECAGYTSKYYDEIGAGKLSLKQMVKKYRS